MKTTLLFLMLLVDCLLLKAQSLNAFLLQYHGPGCDNQSGKLAVNASGGTGSYTYLWSNGSTSDTAYNLSAGPQSVTVYSGNDSVIRSLVLQPFGIDTVHLQHACNGGFGSIFLDNISAQFPLQFHWYFNQNLLPLNVAYVDSLVAGVYQYAMVDGEGCIDSGFVNISASSPHMDVYLSDSSLCWGASSQVWFTPGYTMTTGWGAIYHTAMDTLTYINNAGSSGVPDMAIDSLGCETNSVAPFPFLFLQSHPDPLFLYQTHDTISLSLPPNLLADPDNIYSWYYGGNNISTGAYSYLLIDSAGFYSVTQTNIYNCTLSGSINAAIAGIAPNLISTKVIIYPNPILQDGAWKISVTNLNVAIPYTITDCMGNEIIKSAIAEKNILITAPQLPGIYFLNMNGKVYKLFRF